MWRQKPQLAKLNTIIAGLLLFSSTVGYDGSLMNGLQSLEQWQEFMSHPTGAWLGFINAIQFLGVILGFPLQAWAANRFGRKPTIFVGYFFLAIGAGLQAGATSPAMFIVARLFVGQASAWFQVAVILVTEIAYPSHRSKFSASYQCQYYVGSIFSAWLTFGCRDQDSSWAWRLPSLLQLGIPLLALPFAAMAPESPRWLISQDRHEEARQMVVRYYAEGDESSPFIVAQMDEMSSSIAAEKEAESSTKWTDMVKTSGNRRRFFISVTLGIFAQWNGVGVVSYYLTLILDTIGITSVKDQLMINGFLQLWNLIMAIAGALLVDRVGRRSLFLLSTTIMLVSYIIITGLSGGFATTKSAPIGVSVIPFLFLYYGGYDIAFTPLLLAYPAEIWQFSLRAKGVALTSACTYFALLFNSFVNPIALNAIHWKYYFVYIALLVLIFVVVYLLYPETRGHSLENMAAIFDDDENSSWTDVQFGKKISDPEVDHIECQGIERDDR
ncbi:MFS sugar transporter [Penicillium nucicola]|uniref:MFS sugar transporter n=1 Tax=Penicillium nucicola TaxID=1850975 RepID=UPI002545B996|nr:MFS sugar transporter [Penicillium nucicola]KAJ5747758.1 MFS sugar transporter [Penicillium nucicola]